MGMLSSWNMMSLSHHVVVNIANNRLTKAIYYPYNLIGDDLTLHSMGQFDKYVDLMTSIGVKVSPIKTHINRNCLPTLEFAKKYLINGLVIVTIPSRSIRTLVNGDSRGLGGLFLHLVHNQSSFKFIEICKYLIKLCPSLISSQSMYDTLISIYFKSILPKACGGYNFSSSTITDIFGCYEKGKPVINPLESDTEMKDLISTAYKRPPVLDLVSMSSITDQIFVQLNKHISAKSLEQIRDLMDKKNFCQLAVEDVIQKFGIDDSDSRLGLLYRF